MCNDHEQHVRDPDYQSMMQDLALKIPDHQTERDLPEKDDLRRGGSG
jgi:hypothetical protein